MVKGRHWIWLATAALGFAAGALLRLPAEPAQSDARRVVQASPAQLWTALHPNAVAAASAARAVESAGETPAARHGDEEVQLCGGDWVAAPTDGSFDVLKITALDGQRRAQESIVAGLRADPRELARAAADWLASATPRLPAAAASAPGRCDGNGCAATEPRTVSAALDRLAQAAASTRDPQLYGLAFQACRAAATRSGSCALLSAEQWARLDADNARPWLFLLDDAVARDDAAARDEALHRVATARRSASGRYDVPGLIVERATADERSSLAALLLARSFLRSAAVDAVPLRAVGSSCQGLALADANRSQTCAAVAELLVERADSFPERRLGSLVGEQLGWPLERLELIRAEVEKGQRSGVAAERDESAFASCGLVRKALADLGRKARLGEAASAAAPTALATAQASSRAN